MAAMGDTAALPVSDVSAQRAVSTPSDVPSRSAKVTKASATPLDDLPVEILMKIASFLDYQSLFSLERVSRRCRDAVVLHFGRLSFFSVREIGKYCFVTDPQWNVLSRPQKVTLLSRLTALRELEVHVSDGGNGQWLLKALITASTGWSRLEKLVLDLRRDKLDPKLVGKLCSNLTGLTDIAFLNGATNPIMDAILSASPRNLRGMEFWNNDFMFPKAVAEDLCFSFHLERLTLGLEDRVSSYFPPDGNYHLRHLTLLNCKVTSWDLEWLTELHPDLESFRLDGCGEDSRAGGTEYDRLTPTGLAHLGELPELRSLVLVDIPSVTDWALDQLSKAPLTDLLLGGYVPQFWKSVTPEGLYQVMQSCPALTTVKLWDAKDPKEAIKTISCRSGVTKPELMQMFRDRIWSGHGQGMKFCRFRAPPVVKTQETKGCL